MMWCVSKTNLNIVENIQNLDTISCVNHLWYCYIETSCHLCRQETYGNFEKQFLNCFVIHVHSHHGTMSVYFVLFPFISFHFIWIVYTIFWTAQTCLKCFDSVSSWPKSIFEFSIFAHFYLIICDHPQWPEHDFYDVLFLLNQQKHTFCRLTLPIPTLLMVVWDLSHPFC